METAKHVMYRNILKKKNTPLIIATGPAGTGKTMLPCIQGESHVRNGLYNRVILTRPLVSVASESIGHLPGNVNEKLSPWMNHMLDYCMDYDNIDTIPLGFMRGATWNDAWIIADEMQNSTPSQMKTLLTRVGENSTVVVTGDLSQSDIDGRNGLDDLLQKIKLDEHRYKYVNHITFDIDDIMRSDFVKYVHSLYSL